MALVVKKFGGSSVADAVCLKRVAGLIADTYRQGNEVVAVLSAQGDTTDDLIEKARAINPHPSPREMDMLLSTGEQISVSLCAMALESLDLPVVSLTGWQVGMVTDTNYGNARIKKLTAERIRMELDRKNIVIVAGFQGVNRYDDVTTLGRGGSDTTAVAIAAALRADVCEIYTDVDGVYTADPRLVKSARKLEEITYDEMLELATLGAQVLHNRSVELAKRFHVPLTVLSSFKQVPGTQVKEVLKVEQMNVSGVAKDNNVARIALVGLDDTPGIAFKVFSLLARQKINVDIILQSIGRGETKDISFTVSQNHLDAARATLEAHRDTIGFQEMIISDRISKVSIVGAGMVGNPGVASQMFEAIADANINIQMISTSEIKVSVLLDQKDADLAVQVIHNKFFA
ncbi:MAG: aspartate kinase [Oscillospiraceae bacterium]|jgi:aspartate kinase|nr:aspartate kinase [Oscillospiraceae bacterium]